MKFIVLLLAAAGGLAGMALAATPSLAIDCAKASTGIEKAICSDSRANAADADMSSAFSALLNGLAAPQKKLLLANQHAWIAEREGTCVGGGDDGPAATPAELAACIVRLTDARRNFLSGAPAEGPGITSAIAPVIRHGADDTYLTSLAFLAPETPAEKLFNADLGSDFAKMHIAASADDYSDNFNATLEYASPTLISVNIVGADLSPKLVHPMPFNYNFNIDMQTGKKLTMADALRKPALAAIEKQCIDVQLKNYLANTDGSIGDTDPDMIKVDMADLDRWSFGAHQATLIFDPAEDDPTGVCRVSYADLKKLIKPGFPLPQ
jgi:uncharacterized protein YecT (DUF1311 family)